MARSDERARWPSGAQSTAGAERQRGIRLVLAMVAVLVVAAVALGAVLLNRGGGDGTQADAVQPTSGEASDDGSGTGADEEQDGATADQQDAGTADASSQAAATSAEPCPPSEGDLPTPTTTPYGEAPTVDLGDVEAVQATLATTCGDIVLELDADAAPTTVANFVALAEDGYYEGVGFHRVIDGFMVQGGDPTGTGAGCLDDSCIERLPGYTFPDELGLAEEVVAESGGYPRGTLAMANAGPDTNGSQFFIVHAEPGYPLPPNYAVFGRVVDGMQVVDRIAKGPADGDLAVDPVVIRSVDIQR